VADSRHLQHPLRQGPQQQPGVEVSLGCGPASTAVLHSLLPPLLLTMCVLTALLDADLPGTAAPPAASRSGTPAARKGRQPADPAGSRQQQAAVSQLGSNNRVQAVLDPPSTAVAATRQPPELAAAARLRSASSSPTSVTTGRQGPAVSVSAGEAGGGG